jgi:hypothetical protein
MKYLVTNDGPQRIDIGYHGDRAPDDVLDRFKAGIREAKNRLTAALNKIGTVQGRLGQRNAPGTLTADYVALLRVSFGLPSPAAPEASEAYAAAHRRIRDCLQVIQAGITGPRLVIHQLEEGVPAGVQGYVHPFQGEHLSVWRCAISYCHCKT